MMVTAREAGRRVLGRWSHRLRSLPILALHVHTACNCRCVMCDIWKANAENRSIDLEELERHADSWRRLHVQRVMLTGGEPLLHRNLWALCARLREDGIRISLVTTGLLIARHADSIAQHVDELVVSIDGPPPVHDAIRGIAGAFARTAAGLEVLTQHAVRPRVIARSVVQRGNHAEIVSTVEAVRGIGVDRLSFLAADLTSTAFNRAARWSEPRQAEVAVGADQLDAFASQIAELERRCHEAIADGFLEGGVASLRRIHEYYGAVAGLRRFPPVTCDAPWISAVMGPGGVLRPCFFHPPYDRGAQPTLAEGLNAPQAIRFRRQLDTATDPTCARCVCTLSLAPWAEV